MIQATGPKKRDSSKLKQAQQELIEAVLYISEDGTQKLCGDRCSMHIEQGENKNSCTIHDPSLYIPNIASCGWYKKGAAASDHEAMPMKPFVDPAVSGLVIGKVQCRNCVRSNAGASVCIALSSVLQSVYGLKDAKFPIVPSGCCNWNKSPGQKPPQKKIGVKESEKEPNQDMKSMAGME